MDHIDRTNLLIVRLSVRCALHFNIIANNKHWSNARVAGTIISNEVLALLAPGAVQWLHLGQGAHDRLAWGRQQGLWAGEQLGPVQGVQAAIVHQERLNGEVGVTSGNNRVGLHSCIDVIGGKMQINEDKVKNNKKIHCLLTCSNCLY